MATFEVLSHGENRERIKFLFKLFYKRQVRRFFLVQAQKLHQTQQILHMLTRRCLFWLIQFFEQVKKVQVELIFKNIRVHCCTTILSKSLLI